MTRRLRRLLPWLLPVLVCVYFLAQAHPGLRMGFHPDDIMNLHRAVTDLGGSAAGWWSLLWPFGTAYRPMGAAYYAGVYEVAGLNPAVFRAVTYALLLTNIFLSFWWIRALTGSAELGFLATLVWSYHHRFVDVYSNNGTVYDVLAFTFFLAAAGCYVQARRAPLRWPAALAVVLSFIAAINSKEMAVTLPAVLVALEVLRPVAEGGEWPRLGVRRIVLLASLSAIAAGAVLLKARQGTAFHGVPDYQLHLTWPQYLSAVRHYLEALFLLPEGAITPPHTILFLGLAFAVAALFRSRLIWFCLAWILITPLPVMFITHRGFFVMYLPYLGFGIALAAMVLRIRGQARPARVATAAAFTVALVLWNAGDVYPFLVRADDPEKAAIRKLVEDIGRVRACSGHVLFENEPGNVETYHPVMVNRLLCGDVQQNVEMAWSLRAAGRSTDPQRFDAVLGWQDGVLVRKK